MSDVKEKTAGQPAIKLDDLPRGDNKGQDWKELILGLAKEGASIIELSVALGISRETFYKISEREPQFSDTIKICKELSESWWIRNGRTNLQNKDFSYTGWYMNMKNRFGWKDRQDFTTGGEPLSALVEFVDEPEDSKD